MTSPSGLGPAIPRRRLGAELKRLRDERNKTLADVASDLLISTSKLSRLEKGQAPPSERDVRDLLAYFGVTDTDLGERMRSWAREGRESPWWEGYPTVDPATADYLQFETAATQINAFVRNFVPSLLQTPAYARALTVAMSPGSSESLNEVVAVRMKRQEVIYRDEFPVTLDMVIDESVLRRIVGSAPVMREQLEAVVAASALPAVTLRVLSFGAGPHPAMNEGTFSLFHFRRTIDPDVVNIEGAVVDAYIEQRSRVEAFRRLLDGLRAMALDPESSVDFIQRVAQEY